MFKRVLKDSDSISRATNEPKPKKPYLPPAIRPVNTEPAILLLVDLAWSGDEQAKEFLTVLFPLARRTDAQEPGIRRELVAG
jgi:hypothetical protein